MTSQKTQTELKRYLPHAAGATFAVVGLPVLTVTALRAFGLAMSPLIGTVLGIALSVGIASLVSAAWTRHGRSKDIVFGDLMLWGLLQRLRLERRYSEVTALLGKEGTGSLGSGVVVNPKRQARILKQLATALEARDPYTHRHTRRVTRYAYMTARKIRLSKEEIKKVRVAAAVHDVGKLNIPNEVLHKPGKLTDAEYALIKEHSPRGAEMVSRIGDDEVTAMVRHHHERLDGKGYPDGLAGAQIPLGARIIAVADTFDALTSTRSYRPECTHREAIEILKNEAGSQLDARAVNAFIRYYSGRRRVALWAAITALPQRLLEALPRLPSSGAAGVVQAAVVAAAVAAGSYGGPIQFSRASDAVVSPNQANLHEISVTPDYQKAKNPRRSGKKNSSGSSRPGSLELDPIAEPSIIVDPGPSDVPAGTPSSPGEPEPRSGDTGENRNASPDASNGGSDSDRSGKEPRPGHPAGGAPGSPSDNPGGSGPEGPTTDPADPLAPSEPQSCGNNKHSRDGPKCKRNRGDTGEPAP